MKEQELELLDYYENELFKDADSEEKYLRCKKILENENPNEGRIFDSYIIDQSFYEFKSYKDDRLFKLNTSLECKKVPKGFIKVILYAVQYKEYLLLRKKRETEEFIKNLPEMFY